MLQGLPDGRRRHRPGPRQRALRVRQARDARDHGPQEAEPPEPDAHQPRLLPAPQPQQAAPRLGRVGGEDAPAEAGRERLDGRGHRQLPDGPEQAREPRRSGGGAGGSADGSSGGGSGSGGTPGRAPRAQRPELPVHDALADVHDHDLDDALPHAPVHDHRAVPGGRGHRVIGGRRALRPGLAPTEPTEASDQTQLYLGVLVSTKIPTRQILL